MNNNDNRRSNFLHLLYVKIFGVCVCVFFQKFLE